jgi:hypothetical protein
MLGILSFAMRLSRREARQNDKEMTEVEGMQAFIDQMLKYTILLVRAEPNKFPVGIASGFMIPVDDDFGSRIWPISAFGLGHLSRGSSIPPVFAEGDSIEDFPC